MNILKNQFNVYYINIHQMSTHYINTYMVDTPSNLPYTFIIYIGESNLNSIYVRYLLNKYEIYSLPIFNPPKDIRDGTVKLYPLLYREFPSNYDDLIYHLMEMDIGSSKSLRDKCCALVNNWINIHIGLVDYWKELFPDKWINAYLENPIIKRKNNFVFGAQISLKIAADKYMERNRLQTIFGVCYPDPE